MNKFKKVLAIGAHFDDVEINCGGFLARLKDHGSSVKIVVAGNGEFKHFSGELLRDKKTALKEGVLALNKLNISYEDLICLNYNEKSIPYNVEIIEKIDKILNDYNPDLILTHWIHDTHQDHINTSKSLISAARYFSSIFMWEPIFPSGRTAIMPFTPQVYIDVSDYYKIKIKSLKCHKSQIKKFSKRKINWIGGIISRGKYRGFEINCDYAETFQVVRFKLDF